MPYVEHLGQKYQNNRAENSYKPTGFTGAGDEEIKSAGHAQRFLSVFVIITSFFQPRRHVYTAADYRKVMKSRIVVWEDVIDVESAA